jgi:hypothetical protein
VQVHQALTEDADGDREALDDINIGALGTHESGSVLGSSVSGRGDSTSAAEYAGAAADVPLQLAGAEASNVRPRLAPSVAVPLGTGAVTDA